VLARRLLKGATEVIGLATPDIGNPFFAELASAVEARAATLGYSVILCSTGNRLEQELIYYIEKIDISEEQVRLKNHCDYFRSILEGQDEGKGKKLSFILQEIGREINTTGSKAYDSTIQQCVVLMKDELEKAKEQVLNVL